jgi:hypothetical protein
MICSDCGFALRRTCSTARIPIVCATPVCFSSPGLLDAAPTACPLIDGVSCVSLSLRSARFLTLFRSRTESCAVGPARGQVDVQHSASVSAKVGQLGRQLRHPSRRPQCAQCTQLYRQIHAVRATNSIGVQGMKARARATAERQYCKWLIILPRVFCLVPSCCFRF